MFRRKKDAEELSCGFEDKVNFILDENLLKLFVILVERKKYGS